jgi:hypothetical protein
MNKITRRAFSYLLVFLIPALAMAQMEEFKNSTPQERATLLTESMKSTLSLDEKASTAVAEINLKYANETQALMDSASPKIEKFMTFRKNSQAKDVELKAILTPEQYTLYEQKKSEMQEKIKQKIIEKHQATQ